MDKSSSKDYTYWDYLKLDQLLNLQNGFNSEEKDISTDELHFIIVHQTLELWFKLIISDLMDIRNSFNMDFVPETTIPVVVEKLKRINQIFRLASNHFDVLETLLPQNFLEFRNKLGTASGFQSVQIREIEILIGLQDIERVSLGGSNAIEHIKKASSISEAGKRAWNRIEAIKEETTLKDAVYEWLFRTPIYGSSPNDKNDFKIVNQFISNYLESYNSLLDEQLAKLEATGIDDNETLKKRIESSKDQIFKFLNAENIKNDSREKIKRIRSAILFIESYRDLPLLAWPRLVLDLIIELEELFIIFRHRHARMVERMIGKRVGTGGSAGVDYLDKTTKYRIFTDLWSVRTALLPKYILTQPKNDRFYQFVNK
ncbi:MAG: tryptophan 2,3-dioxygenase family protein [Candidatus Thorarchaeota archaeon]